MMSATNNNNNNNNTASTSSLSGSHPKLSKIGAASFGTVLGITDGDVQVYSCDYDSVDRQQYPDMQSFEMKHQGVYTGFKYQCVELARRYLLVNYGVVFDSIPMAYDIFRLGYVKQVATGRLLKMASYPNGNTTRPVKGSLLIWEPQGFFKVTGHVAVIVDIQPEHVDIVEQNVDDLVWPEGVKYSRRLKAQTGSDGSYTIQVGYEDAKILGWTTVKFNETYEFDDVANCRRDQLNKHIVALPKDAHKIEWLNAADPAVKIFVEKYGTGLAEPGSTEGTYYTVTEEGEKGLKQATETLHQMFLDATDYVLHHQKDIGHNFRIPEKLWPKIRKSWYTRRDDIVAGRFDFSITPMGIKVYEYNADSASCLFECGYIQDRWAKAVGIANVGRDTSTKLFEQLVATWKSKNVSGPLHLMCDNDAEERYHATYMMQAAEAAGIKCKLMVGVDGISWTLEGMLQDSEGVLIQNVWKTWSWRTALNQLSDDEFLAFLDQEEEFQTKTGQRDMKHKPKLVDVLLHLKIRVFEPLWTLLPSCKAILPVLFKIQPKHPYLLKSQFELTPDLVASGYVTKPVTGRAGGNVALYNPNGTLIEKTSGKWAQDQDIYQELCMLPKFDGEHVQVCTWAVDGEYAGTVLRVDKSGIIGLESSVFPLRVISK